MRTSLRSLLALVLFAASAQATVIDKPLPDMAAEAQAQALFHELKCMVCEGQSLADSDAKLAQQMRAKIRQMVGDGKTEAEVLSFFRASYGDQILMQPPFEVKTLFLWLAPCLLLLLGGAIVWNMTREKGRHD